MSTSSTTAPTDDALAALLLSAARAEIRKHPARGEGVRTLLIISGPELSALRHAMRLAPGPAGHCMCPGDLALAVLGEAGEWITITLHHGYTMRWTGPWSWPDVALADPDGFMAWLAERGVTHYLDQASASLARER